MNLQTIETRAVTLAISIFRRQVLKWGKEINTLKDYDSFLNLSPVNASFQKLLEKTILLAYLRGWADERREIGRQLKETEDFKETDFLTELDWTKVGFDDALLKLKKKGIISPAAFKAASAEVKAVTFSVQRIERLNALIALKEKLLYFIDTGLSFRDFKKAVPAIFEANGVTPLKPHHLETVFRTNLGSAYNTARFEASTADPNVEMLTYIGVEDHRLTDICRPFINQTYRKDDPIWNIIKPLNHHRCRCGIRSVTKGYAKRNGIKPSKKPAQDALKKIHSDFNQAPGDIKKYRKKVEGTLNGKEKKLTELTEEIKKRKFKSADSINEAAATVVGVK